MKLTNEEIAERLRKFGYDAEYRETGIIIYVREPMWIRRKEKIRGILQNSGYRGKWGWKLKK